ncbi:outer membrane porin protein 32 precursor [Sulfuriferula multivorans]|uniref:Outer membrane porin protein 32 n=1 Tax=Sulfuriferula multivorans TaxID=1559896 RepID=A0A401JE36_9PROT|nr:porin [Sulfuriferula multivorans]GBL45864.1 outer membrane porin protein 32 precursor [Sulfuriferula multivorans]
MNKKLIALAIASAFVAPVAMADASSVVISGQMHVSVDSLDGKSVNTPTTNSRQTNVSTNASFLQFAGKEDLGNGLNAIWLLKTYVSLGNTGSGGFGDLYNQNGADGLGNGPAYAGLSGASWGAVKLGKDEGPMKLLGRKVDLFNNQIGDVRNFSLGFDTRPNNAIEYNSPSWGGFQANVMHSTNLAKAADPSFATDKSVNLWSATAMYDAGPFFVGLGYEKHGLTSAGAANDEKDWRVSAGGNLGDFKLLGMYEKGTDLGGVSGKDRKVYGLGGAYKMGSNSIKAQYYVAGDLGSVSNTGAKMYAIGFDHSLSKRTTAYLAYARTSNDSGASFSAFGGGHGDNPGTAVGQNPSGFSVGMIHNF